MSEQGHQDGEGGQQRTESLDPIFDGLPLQEEEAKEMKDIAAGMPTISRTMRRSSAVHRAFRKKLRDGGWPEDAKKGMADCVRIFHLKEPVAAWAPHSEKIYRGSTVAAVIVEGHVHCGYSRCSPLDTPSRTEGTGVALANLSIALYESEILDSGILTGHPTSLKDVVGDKWPEKEEGKALHRAITNAVLASTLGGESNPEEMDPRVPILEAYGATDVWLDIGKMVFRLADPNLGQEEQGEDH
jgi:hypothetical protein